MLPISEMSWTRISHPSDVVKVGDTIRLVVINLDPINKKISFSLKQAGPDPWKTVGERYATDMVVSGHVTRIVDFGAFVELEPGLEGLVHISELADHRVKICRRRREARAGSESARDRGGREDTPRSRCRSSA